MELKRKITQDTGSMTIELAIIFPMIICVMIVIFYSLMLYYQQVVTRSVVDETLNQVSLIWGRLREGESAQGLLQQGELSGTKEAIYWQMGVFDHKQEKKQLIEAHVREQLEKSQLLTPKSTVVEISFSNYFIFQRVGITAALTYDPPFPFIDYFIAGRLRVTSTSLVKEQTEIIRNVDFAGDLLEEFQTTQKLKAQYFEKMKEAQRKVKDFFK